MLAVVAVVIISSGGALFFGVIALLAVLGVIEFYRLLRMLQARGARRVRARSRLMLALAQWGSPLARARRRGRRRRP